MACGVCGGVSIMASMIFFFCLGHNSVPKHTVFIILNIMYKCKYLSFLVYRNPFLILYIWLLKQMLQHQRLYNSKCT